MGEKRRYQLNSIIDDISRLQEQIADINEVVGLAIELIGIKYKNDIDQDWDPYCFNWEKIKEILKKEINSKYGNYP